MYRIATRAECDRLRTIDTKANGLPRKGVPVGGGRHVTMTDDPTSPGWTRWRHDVRTHPDRDEHAYPLDDALTGDATKRERLTTRERQDLDGAIAAAVELDETWETKR